MGWYYQNGGTRKALVRELTVSRTDSNSEGITVTTTCLSHCFRGGVFSGVLWTVWQQTFIKDGRNAQPTKRWIGCDLVQYVSGNYGYKHLCEDMGPYYYSCPLGYLALVPIATYGGKQYWRDQVKQHHAEQANKRKQKKLVAH